MDGMSKNETKKCASCREIKGLDDFYNSTRSYCISCEREQARRRMRRYNKTLVGKARQAHKGANRTVKRLEAEKGLRVKNDLTHEDVIFTFALAGGECSYCWQVTDNYQLDHIIPLSAGGDNSYHNITVACGKCNLSKGNKDPVNWHLNNKGKSIDMGVHITLSRMAQRKSLSERQ